MRLVGIFGGYLSVNCRYTVDRLFVFLSGHLIGLMRRLSFHDDSDLLRSFVGCLLIIAIYIR